MPPPIAVSVDANGVIEQNIKTGVSSYAGMWVSKNGKWFPAMVPETYQVANPNPNHRDRLVDRIRTGADGKAIMRLDPAAVAAVAMHWEGQEIKHDYIPIVPFNEPKEPIREAIVEMKEIMLAQAKAQTESMTNLARVLAEALSGRSTGGEPAKRRGRPPKSAPPAEEA